MVEILFEDNHMIAVCKPAGMPTQDSSCGVPSLESILKQMLKEKYNKPGNVFCQPIHRLDRPVSGIVVFAKTSKGLSRLQASLRDGKASKFYVAQVECLPEPPSGLLEHHLVHGDFKAIITDKNAPGAQYCALEYQVEGSSLRIRLLTGRYHQIRAQLAAIGCPIIGDAKYGSKLPFKEGAIALSHERFVIPHPISGELLVISRDACRGG